MQIILSGIISLPNYLVHLKKPRLCTHLQRKCTCCGAANALHKHGSYSRQPDRPMFYGQKSLNPVRILRYICKLCRKTCSVLPECIAPLRWYQWAIQQLVLQQRLDGATWEVINQISGISIKTCRRWFTWLQNSFGKHAHVLKNVAGNLGHLLHDCVNFKSFWQKCFSHISLDRAMLLCHQAGIGIP